MTRRIAHGLKTSVATLAILANLAVAPANAFCGFYVAQADTKLFNTSSKVVLSRNGELTSITMASDFEGDVKEFAVVVSVPTFIERRQIGVVDPKTIDHLDHYTAPRLVEYHDANPCAPPVAVASMMPMAAPPLSRHLSSAEEKNYGVTIEASYDVGEYDVLILSAKESDGLVRWLTDNHYRIPQGAEGVLGSYIKQNMRFFVAKVNVERMTTLGNGYLRPLQVRYQSAKFMVPLRLGTVNAKGPQDLIIYALSKTGRIESANYRTVKIPSDVDVPLYVKDEFGPFYKATFKLAVNKENMRAVFVEYAWDMAWCDPCASDPMSNKELAELARAGSAATVTLHFAAPVARTSMSLVFTCATTPRPSRRTLFCSRPRTVAISRGVTSCITPGRVTRLARPQTPIASRSRSALPGKRRTSRS